MAEGEPSERVLSIADVTVSFGGVVALDGVSLDVRRGEVLGIIGPNGAGKTTLFNVICGFVRPRAGTLHWRGTPLNGARPHALADLGIARTLQGLGLFSGLTVLENVIVGAQRFRRAGVSGSLLGLPRADRDERALRERALAALRRCGCEELAQRMPPTLPYAFQKRVALARALVSEPELLLLDEPAGGLDAEELTELAQTIESLRGSVAVMLVDHHMDLVASVSDRMVVLDFGRVIATGAPEEVGSDLRVLEAYLGRAAGDESRPDAVAAPAAGDARAGRPMTEARDARH
ncbi:MAG: ABC transporter ATP-binding protein [Solirubrobacteraceae bacterium]